MTMRQPPRMQAGQRDLSDNEEQMVLALVAAQVAGGESLASAHLRRRVVRIAMETAVLLTMACGQATVDVLTGEIRWPA